MIATALAPPTRRVPTTALLVITLLLAAVITVAHEHAVDRHGQKAEQVRKCLQDKGPYQVWRHRDRSTFYLLCQLDDEAWGVQAIRRVGNTWHELTAFVPKDGTWTQVTGYLRSFGSRWVAPPP